MVKVRGMPTASPSRRSMRAPMAWNVPSHIPLIDSPTSASTRARISRAALLVNVTAQISSARTRRLAITYAMRWVSTRVLPLPAPAKMSSGPSGASTASRCCAFSPSSNVVAASGMAAARLPGFAEDRANLGGPVRVGMAIRQQVVAWGAPPGALHVVEVDVGDEQLNLVLAGRAGHRPAVGADDDGGAQERGAALDADAVRAGHHHAVLRRGRHGDVV